MDRAELILGTAGHIDHGKTALVRALTGVDTDRLPEEKARGITIELGFAPLELPGGRRLSVIDVPGHERLVRTMVAGATGIDLLLLVVAADEGVMPQTREHLAICELLGLQRAVVALTKVDTVDADIAELARDEVAELLEATPLAGSPIVPTSSVTGEGIDTLRDTLVALAEGTDPRTPRSGPARLPIDRCFEMRGFGSVVTGTLVGAGISVGDAVEIHPSGTKARVRGVQCHGESVERGEPGARCALNLQGVSLDELGRGRVVSHPSALPATHTLDVALQWLSSAPAADGPTRALLLSATSERLARVAPIGEEQIAPGSRSFARVHVEGEPISVLPGDRFVVRGFARTELGATLGGGSVLDVAPPHRRRSDPALLRDLADLARGEPATSLSVRVVRSGLAGMSRRALRLETGLDADTFDSALEGLLALGHVARAGDLCLATDHLASLEDRLLETLTAYHAAEPLRAGMPAAALRGALPGNVPAAASELALERLALRGAAVVENDLVHAADHQVELSSEDTSLADRICKTLAEAGLDPPALRELGDSAGAAGDHLQALLGHLVNEGRVVRAPSDLWFDSAAVEDLKQRVREHFHQQDTLDTQTFKALIGTTRRTAVPLMEFLDAAHFTVRRGDVRRLGRTHD